MKKRINLLLILGIFLTLDVLKFQASAADRLPDLAMMKLRDLNIENTPDGRRLLRFTTIIINIGVGKFELWGQRANTSEPLMSVSQRIFDDAGGYRDRPTNAVMYYAGDGHTHWHVKNLENYALIRLDNGAKVGTGAKRGFCFFDNYIYNLTYAGAPQSPFYKGCGKSPGALGPLRTGLSVGWGDSYGWRLPDQFIDITGLTSGQYRLRAIADYNRWFTESIETNNSTTVDIRLQGNSITILGYGQGY
jgi:hypothetical protein